MSSVGVFSLGASEASSEKIVINVGGVKHETYKSTLLNIPGSRLANLLDSEKPPSEIFFDRNPEVFSHVLQYYRGGKLHCPTNLCGALLEEELVFWGISGMDVEPCCWAAFRKHQDAADALAQIDPSVTDKEDPGQMQISRDSRAWQSKIWALFDDPHSSIAAKVIAITSLLFIMLSIAAFSLKTHRDFHVYQTYHFKMSNESVAEDLKLAGPQPVLDKVELVCLIWFIFEFLMRAVSCPSKRHFFINVLNIVDLLALFPWFLQWCSEKYCVVVLGFLHVMRCIRILRVFKLMRHVLGVRVLKYTLHASGPALCVVPLTFLSCTLIFGTMAYYAELKADTVDSVFMDIPSGFWWAAVTLSTVGYGDMCPISSQGKCVGILCAAVGVLLIVLPVPIIVNNFIMFYSLAKAKCSMPRKREKCSVGTGHSSSMTSA